MSASIARAHWQDGRARGGASTGCERPAPATQPEERRYSEGWLRWGCLCRPTDVENGPSAVFDNLGNIESRLGLSAMAGCAVHDRVRPLQIRDVLEQLIVDAGRHRRHVTRGLLLRLVVLVPLTCDVAMRAADAEGLAVAHVHDGEEAAGGDVAHRLDVLEHLRRRQCLLSR